LNVCLYGFGVIVFLRVLLDVLSEVFGGGSEVCVFVYAQRVVCVLNVYVDVCVEERYVVFCGSVRAIVDGELYEEFLCDVVGEHVTIVSFYGTGIVRDARHIVGIFCRILSTILCGLL